MLPAFVYAPPYPLLKFFEQEGIDVMTLGDEAKLECRYDLFIAQHRVVSEYIYSTQKRFSSILSQFLD